MASSAGRAWSAGRGRARILLDKGRHVNPPIIEVDGTVPVMGFGETVERATEDCARAVVG